MGNVALGGYDVVVHLAETVVNRGLELLPNGSTFPVRERRTITLTALNVPVPGIGNPARNIPLLYDAFLELDRPQVTLEPGTQRVTVTCNLSPASQLTFLRTQNAVDAAVLTGIVPQIALDGSVELDCPFDTLDLSAVLGTQVVAGRAAAARAAGATAALTLVVPSTVGGNVPLAAALLNNVLVSVSPANIQTALQSALGDAIGNAIGDIPLTNPVRLNAGSSPVQTVRDVDARITQVGTVPAISLGVLTGITPASTPTGIPDPASQLGTLGAVIGVGNYWTIQLICQALSAAHPGMRFEFNPGEPSARFRGSVVVEGGDEPVSIREMDVTVNEGGGVKIHAIATASGTCWDARIVVDFVFGFTCDPNTGAITATATQPVVTPDIDTSILCQIVVAVLGAIVGFITGAIIGALVGGGPGGAIIGGLIGAGAGLIGGLVIGDHLIDEGALNGISLDSLSVLGGLTLPLPLGAAGFIAEFCDFDDLLAGGRLVYVDFAEKHRTGTAQFAAGAGFNLDSGTVRIGLDGVSDDDADLFWNGTHLQTLPGARIGPTYNWRSDAFHTLSLTDLERFSYNTTSVSLQALAGRSRLGAWVTFAARTDEGRFAKCRARRDLAGRCHLEFVVYARPPVCLSSVVTLETLSETVIEEGTVVCTDVRNVEVFNPFIDVRPVAPPAATTAALMLARDAQPNPDEPDTLRPPHLQDLFDLSGIDTVALPPRRPRACGTHSTVEYRQFPWQLVEREQSIRLQVLPTGLIPPLSYEWTVFGTALTGAGTTVVGDISITHDENSPILTLVAAQGVDVAGSIVCRATDREGRKARVTRHVNTPSRITIGGCCAKDSGKLTLEDAAQQLDDVRVARRVYEAGISRLRLIAASGEVKEVETVPLLEAVERLRKT